MKYLLRSIPLIAVVIFLNSYQNEPTDTDLPKMDLHAHLSGYFGSNAAMAYQNASALSRKLGVVFGIAEEFGGNNVRINDSLLLHRIALAKKNGLYLGLQVSRRDWTNTFSKESLSQVDYILADAMRFPNKEGRTIAIWVPGMPLGEPEEFMDLYIAHTLKVLSEPINIWASPTFLPDELIERYDELWTDDRMNSVINAAVKNNVAIEINSLYKIPNAKFIKMAKAVGARFTFGTNQHGQGIGEIAWSISMAEECGLTKEDFFIPNPELYTGTFTLEDSITLVELEKPRQQEIPNLNSLIDGIITKSEQDSMIEVRGRSISIIATNVENELWRWEPILQKHNIDLNEFDYKYTYEMSSQDTVRTRYLELGIIDTINNQKVTLKDAILISKYSRDGEEEYLITTAQTFYHDHDQDVYLALNSSTKRFSLTSEVEKPLWESSSYGFLMVYLRLGMMMGR